MTVGRKVGSLIPTWSHGRLLAASQVPCRLGLNRGASSQKKNLYINNMNDFKLLFSMASFLPIAFIYSVNKGITISRILLHYGLPVRCHIPDLASYVLYFAIIIIVTRYVSKLSSKLDKIEIKSSDVKEISSASYTFVATFLGYIFVSLSINNLTTLSIIYIALVAVCSYADIYPYNPVFHFLKYHYYFRDVL